MVTAQTETPSYFPIQINTLQPGRIPPMDLYLRRDQEEDPLLFHNSSLPYTKQDKESLKENEIKELWILDEDRDAYDFYLNKDLASILRDPNVPIASKCELSYDISTQIMKETFSSSEPRKVIEHTSGVLDQVINVIFADNQAAHNFIIQTSMDYELYTHSINVCLYGVAVAKEALKMSEQEALEKVGPGLLLHDIGKLTFPRDVLEREGTLSEKEQIYIKQHPVQGLDMVKESMDVTPETESIILQHHERLDGSGYPLGLKGDEISIPARICAIVDVFDAINTTRPFKPRKPSFETFEQIVKEEIPHRLDRDLFRTFVLQFLSLEEINGKIS